MDFASQLVAHQSVENRDEEEAETQGQQNQIEHG
jgi:hypothetical protein